MTSETLRKTILDFIPEYYNASWQKPEFTPGTTPIPVAGRVFDAEDLVTLVDASLDFWLTSGRYADQLEKNLAQFLGIRGASLCNSGSSANLLAMSALTSSDLGKDALKPGDEVITVAAGFPTTVNPILQNQLIPVFVDIDLLTANINPQLIEAAISKKTRAIFLAHTLGNPFDLGITKQIAEKYHLKFIEDNCDALGSRYQGQYTGTFGELSTLSFYPAHHITTGEGGCVVTNSPRLKRILESFRDWGRDCWCPPGHDNTCGKRFEWNLGELPFGYDHKYTYSHIGYNLKLTDMQAAIGVSQLKKLPEFIRIRKENRDYLRSKLSSLQEFFIFQDATDSSDPSWFGFLITVRTSAPFTRDELVRHLNFRKIGTRLLFAGNLTRQPAYAGKKMRIMGDLAITDFVMRQSFWVGVYPGLSKIMLDFIIDEISDFVQRRKAKN